MPAGLEIDRQCHPQALTRCRDTTLRAQFGPRLRCLNDGIVGVSRALVQHEGAKTQQTTYRRPDGRAGAHSQLAPNSSRTYLRNSTFSQPQPRRCPSLPRQMSVGRFRCSRVPMPFSDMSTRMLSANSWLFATRATLVGSVSAGSPSAVQEEIGILTNRFHKSQLRCRHSSATPARSCGVEL